MGVVMSPCFGSWFEKTKNCGFKSFQIWLYAGVLKWANDPLSRSKFNWPSLFQVTVSTFWSIWNAWCWVCEERTKISRMRPHQSIHVNKRLKILIWLNHIKKIEPAISQIRITNTTTLAITITKRLGEKWKIALFQFASSCQWNFKELKIFGLSSTRN